VNLTVWIPYEGGGDQPTPGGKENKEEITFLLLFAFLIMLIFILLGTYALFTHAKTAPTVRRFGDSVWQRFKVNNKRCPPIPFFFLLTACFSLLASFMFFPSSRFKTDVITAFRGQGPRESPTRTHGGPNYCWAICADWFRQ